MPTAPINLFISYARDDADDLKEFSKYLVTMERQNLITVWKDLGIDPGDEWDAKIKAALEEARIVVFLVSQDLIASSYIYEVELARALERHDRKEITIIPVIIKTCEFSQMAISKLQALPQNAKAVEEWDIKGQAWMSVSKGIRKVVEKLHAQQSGEATIENNTPPNPSVKKPPTIDVKALKDLIADGNEKDAISLLLEKTQSNNNLHNEAIQLSSRYKSAEKNNRLGLVSEAQSNLTLNQIRASLLELINELAKA